MLKLILALRILVSLAHADFGRPLVVAISGGSGSGKTFLANRLLEHLGSDHACLMAMDNFYTQKRWRYVINGRQNYDHPSTLEFADLLADLRAQRAGIATKVLDHAYHAAGDERTPARDLEPRSILILEGLHALHPTVRPLIDLAIFVDVDHAVRLRRRLTRDCTKGFKEGEIRSYFAEIVEPMHQRFVQPRALVADLVIDSPDDPAAVEALIEQLSQLILKRRRTTSNVLAATYGDAVRAASKTRQLKVIPIDQIDVGAVINWPHVTRLSQTIGDFLRSEQPDRVLRLAEYLGANPVHVRAVGDRWSESGLPESLIALKNMGAREVAVKCEGRLSSGIRLVK